jgi:predicted metalloprotease with PDZ domain
VSEIGYRISFPEPHSHLIRVEMRLVPQGDALLLAMPSWTPGSYLMREFPRNVQDFEARAADGTPLPWRKLDKNRWQVDAGGAGEVTVRYRVYANELTVRTSHVDATHAHINGASVFMYVEGREAETHRLQVDAPEGWQTSTALEALSPGVFTAANYDELVDGPLEIGTHNLLEWEQDGVPHAFAIWGRAHHPHPRLVEDTRRIVDAAAAMFGGLPYPRYLFILHLVGTGRGGLEHANSTVLQMPRDCFHGEQYESLLALIAHEFFHVWNVKRIRPEPLGPFHYTRENYTRNLWVSEGLTTYYTDLLLVRAGLMKPERYLERLADAIARHEALPGRHHQSVEESSFDAWIRFYRPDAHSPNAQVSYYHKGALVALLLDMEIRRTSGGERSLDDVMLLLWERYGARDVGFPEEPAQGIRRIAEEVYGGSLEQFFQRYVSGVDELEIDDALAVVGMMRSGGGGTEGGGSEAHDDAAPRTPGHSRHPRSEAVETTPASRAGTPGAPEPSRGMRQDARPTDAALLEARLGIRVAAAGAGAKIGFVLQGTTGHAAGLNAGDEIVALDAFRVSAADLPARIRHRDPETEITLSVFRRDELLSLPVRLGPHPPPRLRLIPDPDATSEQRAIAAAWLRTGADRDG